MQKAEPLFQNGGNKKANEDCQLFIEAVILNKPQIKARELQQQLKKSLGAKISLASISRIRRIVAPNVHVPSGRPKKHTNMVEVNSLGGFELIVALAHHLGWTDEIEKIIFQSATEIKRKETYRKNTKNIDGYKRTLKGYFTKGYNKRKDVRNNRFKSIDDKVSFKNWQSMNIMKNKSKAITRKNLAMLSLPIITSNGKVRTINIASGQSLKHICGFNFKQKTLEKYMSELKYLKLSEKLLLKLGEFWKKHWKEEFDKNYPMLCYYVDGNTKAVWSSERVKQNKVTMLGRVMGCLEQVFIHDMFGNPIYFETHSGHGPTGKRVLELFEKIENTIMEMPKSNTNVSRVIIMDSANNSVETLRSFAKQDNYLYITPLDDNQWDERKILTLGQTQRYEQGDANLTDVTLELQDSKDHKYLITVKAIRVEWDNGKKFVLLHNLPDFIDSSEIVFSYFRRWPCQEHRFKDYKSSISINRVAGYGRKLISQESEGKENEKIKKRIDDIKLLLKDPLRKIKELEEPLADAIKLERTIKNKGKIKNGKRLLPKQYQNEMDNCQKTIKRYQKDIENIKRLHNKNFKKSKRIQQQWFKLRNKNCTYQLDVELDQIMTYYRLSLTNLFAYFIKKFLGCSSISTVMLIERVIRLQATIEISNFVRKVKFDYNSSDPTMMNMLLGAFEKLNKLKIKDVRENRYHFSFCDKSA